MKDITFTFAKITASPTNKAWSQVYNAGSAFALLALSKKADDEEELSKLGKDVFKTFEEEYFTLAERNLDEITRAAKTASSAIPKEYVHAFLVAVLLQDILYLIVEGNAEALLNRGERVGPILLPSKDTELRSASGFIHNNDIIVLTTKEFLQIVNREEVHEALKTQTIQEAAETITPSIHNNDKGEASALFIKIHEQPAFAIEEPAKELETEHEPELPVQTQPETPTPSPEPQNSEKQVAKKRHFSFAGLSKRRLFALVVIIILLLALLAGIAITITQRQNAKLEAQFNAVYPIAQKKYNEGQVLLSLNKPLAQDDLSQAKTLLEQNKDKFPPNSSEEQQIQALLSKVDSALDQAGGAPQPGSKVTKDTNPLLEAEQQTNALAVSQGDSLFVLTSSAISTFANGKTTQITKLTLPLVGLGSFGQNVYAVDTKANQILKFTPSASGYAQTTYSQGSPVVSDAVSITTDTSVWVLMQDGRVHQFLKGIEQSFNTTGYTKGFTKPTKIYTTTELENLYVLDSGSGTVVVFNKSGAYQASYAATELKGAKDIVADEKNSKIFFLSNGEVFSLPLK